MALTLLEILEPRVSKCRVWEGGRSSGKSVCNLDLWFMACGCGVAWEARFTSFRSMGRSANVTIVQGSLVRPLVLHDAGRHPLKIGYRCSVGVAPMHALNLKGN